MTALTGPTGFTGLTGLTGTTGTTGSTTDEARSRAIAAAQALLHQPGAADAAEAWQVVGALDRLGAELRTVCRPSEPAVSPGPSRNTAVTAPPWLAPATALLTRLEEATAWWTGQARFPWASWDETASGELGILLCELDALAADLLSAAAPAQPSSPLAASSPSPSISSVSAVASLAETRPHRRPPARLLPSLGLAAAAVVGVIGGITAAATHGPPGGVPHRAIASIPVPFTLHDANNDSQSLAAAPASLPGISDPVSAIGVPGNIALPTASTVAASTPSHSAAVASATAAAPAVPAPLQPSPRHAAPHPRLHIAPPIPAVNPYQAQLALLAAAIRAADEQQSDPQLHDFNQRVQNVFPIGAP